MRENPCSRRRLLKMACLAALVPLASACGVIPAPTATSGPSLWETVYSERQRATEPGVTEADLDELVAGNNAFALQLYRTVREPDSNLFCSPYSISLALAMTYAGARGETEEQMAEALHFSLSQDRLHPAFNALDQELASRGQGVNEEMGERFQLHVANSIWGQKGYPFLPHFLDVLGENYGAGLRLLDFASAPEESREIINQWVSEETEEKIKDLLPPGSIAAATRLVLANAIYFNASWRYPFPQENTHEGVFHLLDGGNVSVPMMEQTESFGYVEREGFRAVELPYVGRLSVVPDLSLVILLPEAGSFADFAAGLDAEQVSTILAALESRKVHLSLPKFSCESGFTLKEALSAMGMPVAFSGEADFSAMSESAGLIIDDVYHKAFVSVDETGTEAAAATAVVMVEAAMPEEPVEMNVDRPFIFMIRDIPTGAILFLGQLTKPIL